MIKQHTCAWIFLMVAGSAVTAGAQVWKDKQIAAWTPEEARQVLTESPWAQSVTPTLDKSAAPSRVGAGPGGIGIGGAGPITGIGVGVPGLGRRMGRVGSGPSVGGSGADPGQMPPLTVRWASALPVTAAEMVAHEVNAPAIDEDHYALAVYGVPGSMIKGDPNSLGDELKKHAAIKREGKKDMKPSSVQVLMHDEGPVILYLFPRSNEITRKDKVEFGAEFGRWRLAATFVPDEMVYNGKPEL